MIRHMTTFMRTGMRQPILCSSQREELQRLRETYPEATLTELADHLNSACNVQISKTTAWRELRNLGYKQRRGRRPQCQAPEQAPAQQRKRGYASPPELLPVSPSFRKAYPTDLTDEAWAILEPHVPQALTGGRPAHWPRRELVNAMFYVLRNGCTWRALPHDFPPYSTVYDYFRKWRDTGVWQRINDALRPIVRVQAGRDPTPSAASIDSQSVKTTEKRGSGVTTAASA